MPKLAYPLFVLILCVSLSSLIVISLSDNSSFILEPGNEQVITLGLKETDSVSGSFSVVSEDETGINFFVTDPENKTILGYSNVGGKSFSFIAQETGDYELHFSNSVSSANSKTVAVNYSITHYILGMPQEQFLFVLIAAAALIGLLAYVMLMPK